MRNAVDHAPAAYLASVLSVRDKCGVIDPNFQINDDLGGLAITQVREEIKSGSFFGCPSNARRKEENAEYTELIASDAAAKEIPPDSREQSIAIAMEIIMTMKNYIVDILTIVTTKFMSIFLANFIP